MNFRDRIAQLLTDGKLIRQGYQPSDLEMVQAIQDLIDENLDLSRDHARLECLSNLLQEASTVMMQQAVRKSQDGKGFDKYYWLEQGTEKRYEGGSLGECLDAMHKGEHE